MQWRTASAVRGVHTCSVPPDGKGHCRFLAVTFGHWAGTWFCSSGTQAHVLPGTHLKSSWGTIFLLSSRQFLSFTWRPAGTARIKSSFVAFCGRDYDRWETTTLFKGGASKTSSPSWNTFSTDTPACRALAKLVEPEFTRSKAPQSRSSKEMDLLFNSPVSDPGSSLQFWRLSFWLQAGALQTQLQGNLWIKSGTATTHLRSWHQT